MIKAFGTDAWNYGEPTVSFVKVSSRGLIGEDRKALIKRAGHEFVDAIQKSGMSFDRDELPVHLIAVGSTEGYGSNRNGDGFDEETCRAQHDTFVKDARVYQHHKNKDPLKSYGDVKMSMYRDDMRRIELLAFVNGSKEASARHGNLYDEDFADRVRSGEDIPWSMACKVAYDVCSGCGNKAKTRADYCDEDTCKYGGCKSNLTKVAFDGHVLHVNNPHCRYFDISKVSRPADRGAYGGLASYYMQKAAEGEVMGGAALAEAYGMTDSPYMMFGDEAVRAQWFDAQLKVAQALAAADTQIRAAFSQVDQSMSRAFDRDMQPGGLLESFQKTAQMTQHTWGMLAGRLCLPVDEFLSLATGTPVEKQAARAVQVEAALPGVYSRMMKEADFEQQLLSNPYLPGYSGIPAGWYALQKWAQQYEPTYSIQHSFVHERAALAAVQGVGPRQMAKQASAGNVSEAAEALARQYALYKIACVTVATSQRKHEVQLTSRLAVLQNCVQ